jgi:hypothetical protein
MRRNVRHKTRSRGLVGQLAAEKKKAVTALCLIVVMALLWIRVLAKKSPQAAEAVVTAEPVNAEASSNPKSKIAFVELPKVPGRNDVISRNFFDSENWRHFIEGQRRRGGFEGVSIVSRNGNEEIIRKVAQKLKLGAVMISENPRAHINGDTVKVGDTILIDDGIDKYECEVVAIEENTVVITCREARITLKLVQEPTTNN